MTAFSIELITEQPELIFVEVDRRFNVVIEPPRRACLFASTHARKASCGATPSPRLKWTKRRSLPSNKK